MSHKTYKMTLKPIDKKELKNSFLFQYKKMLEENPSLRRIIDAMILEERCFIVGGFIRSIINSESPRDLDIIANFEKKKLGEIIKSYSVSVSENRLGGFKVLGEKITLDVWSINDNWAFKNHLVKNFSNNQVDKIAEGTFFNFDSLVVDIKEFKCNFKHYNICVNSQLLDIIRRDINYRRENPTREANILRVFYLRDTYGLQYSEQLKEYLKEQLDFLDYNFEIRLQKLVAVLEKYEKYKTMSVIRIRELITEIYQVPKICKQEKSKALSLFTFEVKE